MLPHALIEDLQRNMQALLQKSPAADVEKNLKALIAQAFSKLDLVSREELDTLRLQVDHLRERVSALENALEQLTQDK